MLKESSENFGNNLATVLILLVIVSFAFGFLVAGGSVDYKSKKAAISHGCAEYSKETGEFKWK